MPLVYLSSEASDCGRNIRPVVPITMTTRDWQHVDLIKGQLANGQVTFILSPEMWLECRLPNAIQLDWQRVQFTDASLSDLPRDAAGVYCFVLHPTIAGPPEGAYILYIGQTKHFKSRYQRYLRDRFSARARPLIHEMLNKWSEDDLWFYFATVTQTRLLDPIEDALLNGCVPPFNKDFPARINTAVQSLRHLGPLRSGR